MNDLPLPRGLPTEQKDLIAKLGQLWADDPERPRPEKDVLKHWVNLIAGWAETDSLPLYIRKHKDNRGLKIRNRGRLLVPTDNSPPTWAFVLACTGKTPSLRQIKEFVDGDLIPIAFAPNKAEKKRRNRYKCTINSLRKAYPNSAKWKFAHIEPVGLGYKGEITELHLTDLKDHFRKLMIPSNMFVVRQEYAALAELPEFLEQIKKADSGELS